MTNLGHLFDENGRCACGAKKGTTERCELADDNQQTEQASGERYTNQPSRRESVIVDDEMEFSAALGTSSRSSESGVRSEQRTSPESTNQSSGPAIRNSSGAGIVDLSDALNKMNDCKAKGQRLVGMIGLRGSGKTVFLVRLLDALLRTRGVNIPHDSLSFKRWRELKNNRLLARTDEQQIFFYPLDQSPESPYQDLVFVDISGDHLNPDRNILGTEKVIEVLGLCNAYILFYPIDDEDTYEKDNRFHKNNLQQLVSHLIDTCKKANGPGPEERKFRKPLVVAFSKADQYKENPLLQDLNPLEQAKIYFEAFKRTQGFFEYVRFCYISTGRWIWEKNTQSGDEFQYLENSEAPSFGLLDVYNFVVCDPPKGLMLSRNMIKRSRTLNWLSRIPGIGRKERRPTKRHRARPTVANLSGTGDGSEQSSEVGSA